VSIGNGLADTPEEEVLLIHLALAAMGVLVGSISIIWLKGVDWMINHRVLVAPAADPIIALPGAGGAGLDVARVVALVGVFGIAGALSMSTCRGQG
jgi:hypothetical protein